MKKTTQKSLIIRCIPYILLIVLCFVALEEAQALFTITARPYDGGFDLRFEKISVLTPSDAEKEVTITVNTDIGTQYQVYQYVNQPLSSSQGMSLSTRAFSVYTLRGSNSRGTLQLDSEISVTANKTLVYTSNVNGDNDSFIIVYRIHPSLVTHSGFYRGRISFQIEAINSTEPPSTVVLDVEADIEIESSIEITTITGGKTISVESPEKAEMPARVFVSVQGQEQGQYRIMQQVESPISRDGDELREGLTFYVDSKEGGVPAQTSAGPLRYGQSLVYTSDGFGSNDEIEITYQAEDGLKAGNYRGSISYYIESPFSTSMRSGPIEVLPLEVTVEPIFDLKARAEGGGPISFRNLKEGEIHTIEVVIEVETNLAEPYQVTQYISSLLTAKDGTAIAKDYFTFVTKEVDEKNAITKGVLKYPNKSPVDTNEVVVFLSNREGASDIFKVVYELIGPRDQFGGDYTAGIHFSLSQIEFQ